jgi:hypothetical protein
LATEGSGQLTLTLSYACHVMTPGHPAETTQLVCC